MVINHSFQDIIESLNETKTLSLPTSKENTFILSYSSSHSNKTCNSHKPLLPFAASELFYAPINKWRRLTAKDEKCKDVYEISFDIKDSHFKFKPGDTIGIIPQNNQTEVDAVINYLGLNDIADLNYTLSINENERSAKIPVHLPLESTLRHVLTHCVDLRGILKKLFILALSRHTKEDNEKIVLEYLCSKEGSLAYTTHILNKHMCLLDLLATFKSCKPPPDVILGHLPRLLPRPYSIVNSSHSDGNLKICFSVMDIGNRKGLTTGWLEEMILNNNNIETKMLNLSINETCKVPIYIRKNVNEFWLPQNLENPIILIGPGTGVAPYIGFLEEREHLRKMKPDINLGYVWLFFGCRHPKIDFIYENELNYFKSVGVLNKLTASFSRCDDIDKRYVQFEGSEIIHETLKNIFSRHDLVVPEIFEFFYKPSKRFINHKSLQIFYRIRRYFAEIHNTKDAIAHNGDEVAKLILQGAYVYVCGDIKEMATSVKAAIVRCVTQYGNMTSDKAEQYISDMLKEKRYLVDIWN